MIMFPAAGWFSGNSALAVVPTAVLSNIRTETGLFDGCAGVCQVCRTNHMFRHGSAASEKGIGNLLAKSIQAFLKEEP